MSKLRAMLCARMSTSCDWLQAVMSTDWNALYPAPFMILLPAREPKAAWYVDYDPADVPRLLTFVAAIGAWLKYVARMSAAKSGVILEGMDLGYRCAHPGYGTTR